MSNVRFIDKTSRGGARRFAAGMAMLAVALWVAAQPTPATAQTPTPTPAPAVTLAPGGPGRTVTLGA